MLFGDGAEDPHCGEQILKFRSNELPDPAVGDSAERRAATAVAGLVAVPSAAPGERPARHPWRRSGFGPALLAGTFLLVVATLLWLVHSEARQRQQDELADSAQAARESFRLRLQGNEDYLVLLAAERARNTLTPADFQQRIGGYVAAHPELINVTWVDAGYVIRDVAPRAGNQQIIGLTLDLPEPKRVARLARERRAPTYTRPFEAIQGKPSFEVWVPVFRGDEFLGLLAGVYSCAKLVDEALPAALRERHHVELKDAAGGLLAESPSTGILAPGLRHAVELSPPGQGTSLRLAPYAPSAALSGRLLLELLCAALALGMAYSLWALQRDVARRQRAEDELRLAALMYQHSSDAMAVTDADNNIVAVNAAFTRLTGYEADEVLGKNPRLLKSGHHDRAFYAAMWRAIKATGEWQGEISDVRKNGEVFTARLAINTIRAKDGSVERYLSLLSDITEKKKSDDLIWRQANFDRLTRLPNRSMFHDRLEHEITNARRAELPLALLFIDLDRFKEVNDSLGHDQGDLLLVEAARRIGACVRASDTVARMGGDEFTVILAELEDPGCVERIAQHVLRTLAAPFHLGTERAYVSASIGITLFPADATETEDLIRHADQAMYAAKTLGHNRFSYYTPDLQAAAQHRMRLTNDLRDALEAKQFRVHYQPIVDLATGAIRKAEALIRWQHPERGLVSPAEFIPLAEATGLIVDIGNWVFEEAAHQVKHWRTTHHPTFQISVNTSPVQFQSEGGPRNAWSGRLQALHLPGQSIAIEITEGLLLDVAPDVTELLLAFRDAGIQVSLDDFGTGYSSLSYLKKLDIDYLKVDQSFVRNLSADSEDMTLCEAIIMMAHKLGLKVVAEGVETEAQRDLLAAAGCDFGQGYFFSKPVPAADFEALLAREGGPA